MVGVGGCDGFERGGRGVDGALVGRLCSWSHCIIILFRHLYRTLVLWLSLPYAFFCVVQTRYK